IYWDAMLFIYWLEDNPQFAKRVDRIHTRMKERGDALITSTFTLGEVLTGPYRVGAFTQADEADRWMRNLVSDMVPFTAETADLIERFWSMCAIPAADAIHLACAAQSGTDLFLTNDRALIGKVVPGIHFIASLEAPLL